MSDIGSVSVRVVPSAKNFVSEMKAQILPGMQRLGAEAGVRFRSGFEDSVGKVHVQVEADTTKARAQIAELQKAASGGSSNKGGLLLPAIVGLGPALIPVAAAAASAGGALALMGASGILAVQGIKKEMASGSAIGQDYTAGIQTLKKELGRLEQTAAKGLLGPFNDAVAKSQTLMPDLNRQVGVFSALTGRAGGNLLTGLVAGFHTMEPLITLIADDIVRLTGSFARFAEGGGLQKFAAYAQSQLPLVESTLKEVAQAIIAISSAMGPMGSISLTALKLLAEGINAIPVDVLRILVPLAGASYLAFRSWGTLGPIFTTAKTALVGFNEAMAVQTALASASGISVGKFGAATAVAQTRMQTTAGAFGVAAVAAGGLILANNALADHFRTTAASADVAADVLKRFSQTGQLSSAQLNQLGVQSGNLGKVIENAFNESNLTKLKDFQFGLGGIIHTPFNSATTDMRNFFKSTDSGLSQLATGGNVNAAKSALQDLSTQTGVSIDQLLTKLPDLRKVLDAVAQPTQIVRVNGVIMATTDSLTKLGSVYGITGKQAENYAGITGITADQIKNSTVSLQALTNAVATVSHAYATGNQSVQDYLGALDAFSKSAGTAADRATLIGATLRAANGDNLSFASTMNTAATANQTLVDAMHNGALNTVDWKTGLIDFNNSAASPLITALDGVQTAAMNAASATFQHELATKGAKLAADDAYTTYVTRTQGALIDEAQKFGLTRDQAKRFSDQYFGLANAPDIKKKIEQQGGDPVQKLLASIENTLEIIAGIRPNPTVSLNDQASAKAQAILGYINDIPNYKLVTITVKDDSPIGRPRIYQTIEPNPPAKAAGGGVNDGWFTMNEQGWELGHKQGNKLQIYSHQQSKKMLPQGPAVAAYASGSSNPFTGVDYSGGTAASTAKKTAAAASSAAKANTAAIKAAQTLAASQANIRFTTSLDLSGLSKAALGSQSGIASIMRKLITDVHSAVGKGFGSNALIGQLQAENTRLSSLANQRATLSTKLKAAQQKLVDASKLYSDEKNAVAGAVTSNFNITSVDGPASFGVANPKDFLKNLTIEANQATKFSTQLGALKGKINNSLLKQLGEGGVSGSGAAVASLSTFTPAQIAQVNKLFAQTSAAGQRAGINVADPLYKAGVESARGYINGLRSELTQVNGAAAELANTVIKQIKKSLGIKSPSSVAHDLAGYTVAGFTNGLDDRLHLVRKSAGRMANAAVQPGQFVAGGGAGAPAVHVYPSAGMNEEAIGEAAARRIAARRV